MSQNTHQYLEHCHTTRLFIVDLRFKLNWVSLASLQPCLGQQGGRGSPLAGSHQPGPPCGAIGCSSSLSLTVHTLSILPEGTFPSREPGGSGGSRSAHCTVCGPQGHTGEGVDGRAAPPVSLFSPSLLSPSSEILNTPIRRAQSCLCVSGEGGQGRAVGVSRAALMTTSTPSPPP